MVACAALLACAAGVSSSCSKAVPQAPQAPQSPFAAITVPAAAGAFELWKGEYLVAVLNATCEDCKGTVSTLNGFVMAEGLPMLVGLVMGDDNALQEFQRQTNPVFPTTPVTPELFFQLIGEAPPRLLHIKDGVQLAFWDGEEAFAKLLKAGTLTVALMNK